MRVVLYIMKIRNTLRGMFHKRWRFVGLLLIGPALVSAESCNSYSGNDYVACHLKHDVQSWLTNYTHANNYGNKAIRELPENALAILALSQYNSGQFQVTGGDPDQLLQDLFNKQFLSGAAPGNLPWVYRDTTPTDLNAIDFAMQPLGPILTHYSAQLSPTTLAAASVFIKNAYPAIISQNIPVSYTNIYVMEFVALILSGEWNNDLVMANEGYHRMYLWWMELKNNGIHEYDSPFYTAADLQSLLMGYDNASWSPGKAWFKTALDYIWTDLAANYFSPRGSLSGPHSRDYDFPYGLGALPPYYYAEMPNLGLPWTLAPAAQDDSFLVENLTYTNGYHPTHSLVAPLTPPSSTGNLIQEKWGPDLASNGHPSGMNRTNFITPDFSIGGVSLNYDNQDRNWSIELTQTSTTALPSIAVISDPDPTLNNQFYPLCYNNTVLQATHDKQFHLTMRPMSVQRKGALLAMGAVIPNDMAGLAVSNGSNGTKTDLLSTNLLTNIMLPSAADKIVADQTTQPLSTSGLTFSTATVIGIRQGNSCAAIRIFHADGCDGQLSQFSYISDQNDNPPVDTYGLVRYSVTHCSGDANIPTLTDPVRIGILMLAASCANDTQFQNLLDNARNTVFNESTHNANDSNEDWQVTTQNLLRPEDNSTPLTLSGKRFYGRNTGYIIDQSVDGDSAVIPNPYPLLAVNGIDVGNQLLNSLTLNQADLSLQAVTTSLSGAVGVPLTSILTLQNTGSQTAQQTSFIDTFPTSVTVTTATISQGSCQITNNTVTCSVGDIAPGVTYTVTVTLVPSTLGSWTSTAIVTSPTFDPDTADNTVVTSVNVDSLGPNGILPQPILNSYPNEIPLDFSFSIEQFPYSTLNVSPTFTLTVTAANTGNSLGTGTLENIGLTAHFQSFGFTLQSLGLSPAPGPYQFSLVASAGGLQSASTQGTFILDTNNFSALRVYPNPWRSDQDRGIKLIFDGLPANATVKLFDLSGNWIKTLQATDWSVSWDLTNNSGQKVASGIYLYTITASGEQKTEGKIVVIR